MLKREIDSINRMIATQYERLRINEMKKLKTANHALAEKFFTDPVIEKRIHGLAEQLDLPVGVIRQNVTGSGYGVFGGKNMPLRMDLESNGWVQAVPEVMTWSSTPLHGAVEIALASSPKKWAGIQPAVYAFAADCNAAKSLEDLEKSVKVLLASLA